MFLVLSCEGIPRAYAGYLVSSPVDSGLPCDHGHGGSLVHTYHAGYAGPPASPIVPTLCQSVPKCLHFWVAAPKQKDGAELLEGGMESLSRLVLQPCSSVGWV